MCGIAGILDLEGRPVAPDDVAAMCSAITHRGPDAEGAYVAGGVGLGMQRLAIIDLSTGDQPIANEDGSVWVVFNGELYNFQELRRDLLARGHRFRTTGDTEVLVHLYEDRGDDCCTFFNQCRGDTEFRHPIHQGLCAVDGVHNPHARMGESGWIVGGLFREPSIPWKLSSLHLMQDPVDLVVHGGDRRMVWLLLDFETIPDHFTDLHAGLPDRLDQRIELPVHRACLAEWKKKSSRSYRIGKAERQPLWTGADGPLDPRREHAYKQGILRGHDR